MSSQPLEVLHVIGVRYRGSRPAQGDERALDAYTRANVYQQAQVPVVYGEVVFPEHLRSITVPLLPCWYAPPSGIPVLLAFVLILQREVRQDIASAGRCWGGRPG